MRKLFLFLPLLFLINEMWAGPGDTTIVQTFTFEEQNNPETAYDSPGRRWFQFPEDDGTSYQKILMYYTLKCFEDGTAGNLGFPCGEWDYLTYTYLFDHTGMMDSTALQHPRFLLNNLEFESASLSSEPQYDIYAYEFGNHNVLQIYEEEHFEVGMSMSETAVTMANDARGARCQYLYTADELLATGLEAGPIHKIALNVAQLGEFNNSWIRMKYKLTDATNLDSYEEDGMEEVFSWVTDSWIEGWNEMFLGMGFNWDGESSLVLEFIIENNTPGSPMVLLGDEVPGEDQRALVRTKGLDHGKYAVFTESDEIKVPEEVFASLDDEVTVSFWVNGFEDIQPQNGTCFEGVDASNNRVLNSHLPWSNSRVYWDAGWDGGYDRIDKAASPANFEGQWNHWAFTKNNNTGEMKIYLNGVLWHSGEDKDNSMAGIVDFSIGSAAGWSNFYNGRIDEFRIWNTELDEATISTWMHDPVTADHPNYSNLLLQYHFNEVTGEPITSDGGVDVQGVALGSVNFVNHHAESLFFNETGQYSEGLDVRPSIRLSRGDYESDLLINSYEIYTPVAAQSLAEYEVIGNDVEITGVSYLWEPGVTYMFDENGDVLITFPTAEADTEVSNETLDYFSAPFEVIDRYEIGRFITPYGINLSLGDDGWTWVYDVTDFEPLLHGEVELQAGNWQELLDLKFAFIEGTPPRDVSRVEKVWSGNFNLSNFDENVTAQTIDVLEGEESFRLKATTSGHQFDNNTNCAEFCYKIHSVDVNGNMEYSWQIMEECADNPLYPQGGTWVFDRAGWCPGAPVTTQDLDLTPYIDGDSFEVDYNIESDPYGNYIFEGYMIAYGENNFNLDVEISEIVAPTNMKIKSRINPICDNPVVKIRNNGTQTLTSCRFDYHIGGETQTYFWEGELEFMETEDVELLYTDPSIWRGNPDELSTFEVTVSEPNGSMDENEFNNTATSQFYRPPVYAYDDFEDDRIIIWVRTNNAPQETSYTLYDIDGNVVYERDDFVDAGTNHRDTIPLDPGCYFFHLKDSDDDGMDFFANNDGNGYALLRRVAAGNLVLFENDFGKEIRHYFSWNIDPLSVNEAIAKRELKLFPNPASAECYIEIPESSSKISYTLTDLKGRVVRREEALRRSRSHLERIDLSDLAPGMYALSYYDGKNWYRSKIVKE